MGVPPSRYTRPLSQAGWRYTLPDAEQHSKYFLHGGRYASGVHAGGLSCLKDFGVFAAPYNGSEAQPYIKYLEISQGRSNVFKGTP